MINTKELKKYIISYINTTLKSSRIINLSNLYMGFKEYMSVSVSNGNAYQKEMKLIQDFGKKYIDYLDENGLVYKCSLPNRVTLYALRKTIDEIRQLGQNYRNIKIIKPELLGDRGISGELLSIMCKYAIPDFPFQYCNDDYSKLVNKCCIQDYTCNNCHKVFYKTYLSFGERYCSECMKTAVAINGTQSISFEKSIELLVDEYLTHKKILILMYFWEVYIEKYNPNYFQSLDSDSKSEYKNKIRNIAYNYLEKLTDPSLKESIIKINIDRRFAIRYGDIYMMKDTMDKFLQVAQSLSYTEKTIEFSRLGDLGKKVDPLLFWAMLGTFRINFPFAFCKGYPWNAEYRIHWYTLVNKKFVREYTCQKCQILSGNLSDYRGQRICSDCFEEVLLKANKGDQSVVLEINPNDSQMSNDMEDIIAELNSK